MKNNMLGNKNKGQFGSKIGFVLASAGSAIGMGNIWMFPYRVGQYGGAAFLIPYFIFVILFGIVGLSGEFALGRLTGTGPIGSYEYALKTRGKKGGALLGTIPLLGSLGIGIGYAIIVGWVLRSIWGTLSGNIFSSGSAEYFSQGTAPFSSIPWHLAVIVITLAILICGVINGIEKFNKILMPLFFILFIIIAIRVMFLPGAIEGYKYLLIPKWEYLFKPITWIMAMGQAFFSLSITGSGMIIYGSYLSKNEDIPHSSFLTAILDTCAALLSGFAMIPAVFAFGMSPLSGPPLMFITMPKIFEEMAFGRFFGVLFFISVFFAGITSLINILEVCIEAVESRLNFKRLTSVILIGIVTFAVGVFIEYEPYLGKWMDIITIYVTPIGAVMGAIIIYWVLGTDKISDELNLGRNKPIKNSFKFVAKYIYVLIAIIIIVLGIALGGIG